MMFEYGNNWGFWQVALIWVGMIAFWGLLIWAVYALATSSAGSARSDKLGRNRDGGNDAGHILDQRLAKGEINADEYHRLRDLIRNDDPVPVATGDRR